MKTLFAQIAQSVEQRIENPRVGGSIPPLGTTLKRPVIWLAFFVWKFFFLTTRVDPSTGATVAVNNKSFAVYLSSGAAFLKMLMTDKQLDSVIANWINSF